MTVDISIVRTPDYSYKSVYKGIREAVELLGNINKFIRRGDKILLKPNMLAPLSPHFSVTTHPMIVKVVGEIVRDCGGIPIIGDSPPFGNLYRVAEKCGILDVAKNDGIEIKEFNESIKINGNIFKEIEIAKIINEVDGVINLPKFKTHSQMLLTLGVKNLFGLVISKRKAQWHLRCGANKLLFATMLLDIYNFVKPRLTVMDAITGMEGNGPGRGGTPKDIGLIIAGEDAVAMDLVICYILNVNKDKLPTIKSALMNGIGETRLENISILGENIDNIKIPDFKLPLQRNLEFGHPFIKRHLRNLFTPKLKINISLCNLCSSCADICPAKVIYKENKKIEIDHNRCISCFCCHEICPQGAILIKDGLFERWVK